MNRKNELCYEIVKGYINSEVAISFWDKFSHNFSKKTVEIMAQASIQTSDRRLNKLEEWKSKRLEIFWWPTYSPKHNIIEILWKFIML